MFKPYYKLQYDVFHYILPHKRHDVVVAVT